MTKKQLFFLATLILVLGGGWFFFGKQAIAPPTPPSEPTQESPTVSEEPIDTSDWKTYRNEEYGFEFKYPETWVVEEKFIDTKNYGGNRNHFRYVLLDTGSFNIEIGIKGVNESETINLQGWRTGMPAGDFQRNGLVDVAGGIAERRYLIDTDTSGKKLTRMILFCKPNENLDQLCNPFSLGKDKLGAIGVYSLQESETDPWQEIESVIGTLVKTMSVF